MRQIILAATQQDLHKRNYCYEKDIMKIQSNIATWKNRMLDCLKVNIATIVFLCLLLTTIYVIKFMFEK